MIDELAQRRLPQNRSESGPRRLRSLVVPIDLTPVSDRVLARVARLPLADDARITLLHVVPRSLPGEAQREARERADELLAAEIRELHGSLGKQVTIQPRIPVGLPVKEIGACATREKAELVVMGRGGGRPVREAFLGSTAERVIRQARLPVLAVRTSPRAGYQRPALALDLDQAAQEAVRLLLRLVPPPRPRVEIIHAYEIPYAGIIHNTVAHDVFAETKDAFHRKATLEIRKRVTAALERAGIRLDEAPVCRYHVAHGSPRSVVLKALRRLAPDLLVLGTRGYSQAAHIFLGTVAGDLLRAASCDVLVVPPTARL